MTEEQLLDGNKLIAEFMGANPDIGFSIGFDMSGNEYFNKDYLYHSSWDWLMPVGKKIMDLKLVESQDMCQREQTFYLTPIRNAVSNFEIIHTWETVTKFIKWYNNQTK